MPPRFESDEATGGEQGAEGIWGTKRAMRALTSWRVSMVRHREGMGGVE